MHTGDDRLHTELCADMAQLVERTLGKGEVPSSTLGISTTIIEPRFGGVFVFYVILALIALLYDLTMGLLNRHPQFADGGLGLLALR